MPENIPAVELERIIEYKFTCGHCGATNHPQTSEDSHEDMMDFNKIVPCYGCGKNNKVKF